MAILIHPLKKDIKLRHILNALADPIRLIIVSSLYKNTDCTSCTDANPKPEMAKSTLSHHFRILREAGLIHTVKQGVSHQNKLRKKEIDKLFPGLLKAIIKFSE